MGTCSGGKRMFLVPSTSPDEKILIMKNIFHLFSLKFPWIDRPRTVYSVYHSLHCLLPNHGTNMNIIRAQLFKASLA